MTAGQNVTPKDHAGVQRLKDYWAHGTGAAKIGWGTDGDFDRCISLVQEAVTKGGSKPLPDHMIKGLCSNLHQEATGARPGHAPAEEAERKAKQGAGKAAH